MPKRHSYEPERVSEAGANQLPPEALGTNEMNIDQYLDELEQSIHNRQPKRKNFEHFRLSGSEFTSGEETSAAASSSANSRKHILRRPSILPPTAEPHIINHSSTSSQLLHSNPSLSTLMAGASATSIPPLLTSSQTVLLGSSLNSYSPSMLSGARPNRHLDGDISHDVIPAGSIHFATPFEIHTQKQRRIGDQRSLATVRLIWRSLTYRTAGASKKNSNSPTVSPNLNNSKINSRRTLILDKQSGDVHGGQLSAIIGPSGAGKSTLLECLAGRRTQRLGGSVFIEQPLDQISHRVRISFIAQKDIVIGVLTVRETLTFASRLKNYALIKNSHYHARLVSALLAELQLDKCADIAAGRISGGQLKRLSFALELISGPDVLLLDEPTSGLDSSSAGATIRLLRKLTDLRRAAPPANAWRYKPPAIMCSIHQPSASVLQLFHRIYVLSSDGRCVYHGPPHNLLPHLARFDLHCPQFHNPADFVVEVASGDHGQQAIHQLAKHMRMTFEQLADSADDAVIAMDDEHKFDHSPGSSEEDTPPRKLPPSSAELANGPTRRKAYRRRNENPRMKRMKVTKVLQRMKQQRYPIFSHFSLLLKRTYLTTSRDPKLTWFRILQALFIGGVMAFLYDYPIGSQDGCILDNKSANSTTEAESDGNMLNSRTQDNIAFIFFITLFTVMASMMPTVLTFPTEVSVLIQERNNGWYSCWSYYWTKIIADTPYQLIITMTFCAIVYPATGQPWVWWRFALFNLISVLVAMIAQSVGILFGTIYVQSVETAVFMAPLSMAPVFLLSGFFAKVSKLPWFLKPIAFVSYVRYAFEAFLVSIYGLSRCEDVPLFFDTSGGLVDEAGEYPTDSNTLAENRPSSRYSSAFRSRAEELFRRVPKYAAEFPKVWSGFYNPVAYAQELENQGEFLPDDTSQDMPGVTPSPYDSAITSHLNNSSDSLVGVSKAFPTGSFVLNHFELEDANLWENLLILFGILMLLRIVGYLLLVYKTNQRK